MVGITRSKVISALRGNIEWQCAIAKQAHLSTVMRRRLISKSTSPFLSLPFLPFPSFPFLSLPFPSFPFLSLSFPFFPFLSLSFRSFPVLSILFPSFPFLSLPFPSFPFLSRSKGSRCPTVRNHSQPSTRLLYGRASGKFSRRANFCVSRGRRGTSWHSDVFCNVSKVILCGKGALLLRRFQKMRCSFRGRRSTLDVSIVILPSRRSTLDASCCVFFTNRIGRAASSGDKVQIPWQTWHFVRCAENWRKPPTKHRFWGSKFKGSYENSQENVNFEAVYKVWKLEEVSHERLVLMLPHLSSQVSGFPVASLCLWGKLQNLSFSKVSKQVVIRFAWQGWHFTLYTPPHSTLWPLCTLLTLHSTTLYTLHTPHSTL